MQFTVALCSHSSFLWHGNMESTLSVLNFIKLNTAMQWKAHHASILINSTLMRVHIQPKVREREHVATLLNEKLITVAENLVSNRMGKGSC